MKLILAQYQLKMQKRIKMEDIMRSRNHRFPEEWNKILNSITPKHPILIINNFAKVVLINHELCLIINKQLLKNYSSIINLPVHYQNIISKYQKNKPIEEYTQTQIYLFDFFADFLKNLFPGHTNHIYFFVIDLSVLGKLLISSNTIQYINVEHQWKYELNKNTINLPKIIPIDAQKQKQSLEKMNRKLSLSLKKQRKVQKGRKKSFRLSNSSGNILKNYSNSLERNSEVNQKLKVNIQKRLKIKTQISNRSQTETQQKLEKANRPYFFNKQPNKSGSAISLEISSKSISQKKAKEKLNYEKCKQSNRITSQIKDNKKNLFLRQRTKLKHDIFQKNDDFQKIRRFIIRLNQQLSKCTEFLEFKLFDQKYVDQVCQIYIKIGKQVERKKKEYQQAFQNKKVLENKGERIYFQLKNSQYFDSICLNIKQQNILTQCFQLTTSHLALYRRSCFDYIVNLSKKINLVDNYLEKLQTLLQSAREQSKIQIHISHLLRLYFEKTLEIESLNIQKAQKGKRVLQISVSSIDSFLSNTQKESELFEKIFQRIIQFMKLKGLKGLFFQDFEIQKIKNIKQRIYTLLINYRKNIEEYTERFINRQSQQMFNEHIEQNKYQIIEKINLFKNEKKQEAENFIMKLKGVQISFRGFHQNFFNKIENSLLKNFNFFYNLHYKYSGDLNKKLNMIITIDTQYLNEYKCIEYKMSIIQIYDKLFKNMRILIYQIPQFFKNDDMEKALKEIYIYKQSITKHFQDFELKLIDYKKTSTKIIKSLEIKNKNSKRVLQELTSNLKKVLLTITNQKLLLENVTLIQKLQQEYRVYLQQNELIVKGMIENQMVYWEDDDFFKINIFILKECIYFLESQTYKTLFNAFISQIDIEQFQEAFHQFSAFIHKIADNKLQKIFKPNFSLLQNNLFLAEILLYKDYTFEDNNKLKQNGLDLNSFKNQRFFKCLKKFCNLDRLKFSTISQIYRCSKLNKYAMNQFFSIQKIKIEKAISKFNIIYYVNIDDIKKNLQNYSFFEYSPFLEDIKRIQKMYYELIIFHRLMSSISNNGIQAQVRNKICKQINEEFENILPLPLLQFKYSNLYKKLQNYKDKYVEVYYLQKIIIFQKYILLSLPELLDSEDWSSPEIIKKNIQSLYKDVDDVLIQNNHQLRQIIIGKDRLVFEKPLNISIKQGNKSKIVHNFVQTFIKNSLSSSQFACGQIKILIWHIYFTQQVQFHILTQKPFKRLKDSILNIIDQFITELRYDIKLHHKQYEIDQLKLFVDHLDKIVNIKSVTDYEWNSTVRFYEKVKYVKILQNSSTYQFGFEPKKPLTFDPSFQLETAISYGYKESSYFYEMSSYILGKAFAIFDRIQNFGFRINFSPLINIVKKEGYYLKIMVNHIHTKHINNLHKKVIQFNIKTQTSEQDLKHLPIFFQYSEEKYFPPCFTEKNRKIVNTQLAYSLNILILMKLNNHQTLINQTRLNVNDLCKILTYIKNQRNLSFKIILLFLQNLIDHLLTKPSKQLIYKYCFIYFLSNFQITEEKLNLLLKNLIISDTQINDNQLFSSIDNLIASIKSKQLRKNILFYGPSSCKTYFIKQKHQIKYHSEYSNDVIHIEGVSQYLRIRAISPRETLFLIEQAYIWDIDPQTVQQCLLFYVRELTHQTIYKNFTTKLANLFFHHSHEQLQKMWFYFYEIYKTFKSLKSSLSTYESISNYATLVLKNFQHHCREQIIEQSKQKEDYRLDLYKEVIHSFLLITFEIFYYSLSHKHRKQFIQLIKQCQLFKEEKIDEFYTYTSIGLNSSKMFQLVKKQKKQKNRMVNYSKQIILIQKYLKFSEPISLVYEDYFVKSFLKQYLTELIQENYIYLSLNNQHLKFLRNNKTKMVYIIEDVHLGTKDNQLQIKIKMQHQNTTQQKFILLQENSRNYCHLRPSIKFCFDEVEFDQIYKYQFKEGIPQLMLQKCQLLYKLDYFSDKLKYLQFLKNITIKLPSQYYKKYFPRQLILLKLTLNQPTINIINKWQGFIKQKIDLSSEQFYFYYNKGYYQQISLVELSKKIQKFISTRKINFFEKSVIKSYYKQLIPYLFADKIYIIKEQVLVLSYLIPEIQQRPHFTLKNINFIPDLVNIIKSYVRKPLEFTIIIEEPVSTSQQFQTFLSFYLQKIDLVNIYQEFSEEAQKIARQIQFVERMKDQTKVVKEKMQFILLSKMSIIISLTGQSSFPFKLKREFENQIIHINACFTNQKREQFFRLIYENTTKNIKKDIKQQIQKNLPVMINLVLFNLLSLNRCEHFFLNLINFFDHFQKMVQAKKKNYNNNLKLVEDLKQIQQNIQKQLTLFTIQSMKSEQFLNQLITLLPNQQFENTIDIIDHFDQLVKIRQQFYTTERINSQFKLSQNQEHNLLIAEIQKYQHLFSIKITDRIPMIKIRNQQFIKLLETKSIFKQFKEFIDVCNKVSQSNKLIFHYYLNFLLALILAYQKINYTPLMIQKQCERLNYFYKLQIIMKLKQLQTQKINRINRMNFKKTILSLFKKTVSFLQNVSLNFNQIILIEKQKLMKRIIRNNSIESIQLISNQPFKQHLHDENINNQVLFEYDLLNSIEEEFEEFNKQIIIENSYLLVYDPYQRLESLCYDLQIEIIYLKNEADIYQINNYKFEKTIFCIKINSLRQYYDKIQMIQLCIDLISKKHADIKESKIQKLLLMCTHSDIFQQIDYNFVTINLNYTYQKIHHIVTNQLLNQNSQWEKNKIEYLEAKQAIKNEIHLIKNLQNMQILLYIEKINKVVQNFDKKKQLIQKCCRQKSNYLIQEQHLFKFYQFVIKNNQNMQIPINYLLRVLKQTNLRELIMKVARQQCINIRKQMSLNSNEIKQEDENIESTYQNQKSYSLISEITDCLKQSRYIIVIYENFTKKLLRDILQIQENSNYQVKTIIEISDAQIEQFVTGNSKILPNKEKNQIQLVFVFVKHFQLAKLYKILNKSAIIWI